MKTTFKFLPVIAALFLLSAGSAKADVLIESYTAFLSENDHFSSKGQRLTNAAAIIRQDRANYHKFGLNDADDEGDSYFNKASNRELLEKLINRGKSTPSAIKMIVNGMPYVTVSIFRSDEGYDYVNVSVTR